jgi:hypothetical protein
MAYDFSAVCSTGQTLYYNITSDVEPYTVEVTSETGSGYNTQPTGDLEIPETVEYNSITYSVISIGYVAFSECSELTSVTIPNSVETIGASAFETCRGLTIVTLGSSVIIFEDYAFAECSELTSITIPNSVTEISFSVFWGCFGLEAIVVESGNGRYDSRDNCNAIIETETNTLIIGCKNTIIPSSVTKIGDYAFSDCTRLMSISIPNSVTNIGENAFNGCSSLTSVTIGDSVESIGSYAFGGCSGLTMVTIPNSVTSIGSGAFNGCSGLTSVIIPSSVTNIGVNPFCCEMLETIVVESENLIYDSRNNCNAIIETSTNTLISGCKNTTIANSVESIGNSAFSGCSGLTSVTIPNSVTSIGSNAFSYCSGLTEIIIPNSVEIIGISAFEFCSGLTSVTIPNSVTSIGSNAFSICDEITSVIIGNSVDSIAPQTFFGCLMLTMVTIGNQIDHIGYQAFEQCESIRDIYILANTPPTFDDSNAFTSTTYTTATLWTPCGLADTYGNATNWSNFTNISEHFQYTLNVLSSNEQYGTASIRQQPDCTDNIAVIEATPNQDYRFVSWNDGNTDNPRTITVTSDSTFVANFRSAETIFWSCDFEGDEIWTFGNDQPDGNVQWQITTPETYPSTLISGDNAYLTPFVFNGDTLNITPEHWALADLISQLTDFGGPGQVAESSWIEFSWIDLSEAAQPQITFRQIFKQLTGVETSIRVSTDGGQTWTDHIVNEEVEDNTYGEYEIRTGIREAAGEGNVKIRFLINSDAHVVQMGYGWEIDDIEIKEAPDTIIATAGEGGTISPNGEVLVDIGESVTFTITPNDGYRIASVMVDETENVTDQLVDGTYTFVDVIENHTIAATFEEIHTYTIIVLSNNDAYGMVSEGGTFEEGAVFEIAAMPNDGYRFVSWNDGNAENPRTITVTSDSTFVANFIQIDIDGGIERRNVLVELFAYKNCGYSPYAAAALDNMEAADSLNIIVIDHHVSDTYGYTESMNRFYYWAEKDDILGQSYGFDGTPSVVFDGYLGMSGTNTNVDEMQETYIGYYNNVKAIKSIYSLTAELEQTEFNGRTFSLNVTAEKHSEYFGDDQIVVMAALA